MKRIGHLLLLVGFLAGAFLAMRRELEFDEPRDLDESGVPFVADFDGDGGDDLAVVGERGAQLFPGPVEVPRAVSIAQAIPEPASIRVGDVDGDGAPELLYASETAGRVGWLRAAGARFAEAGSVSVPSARDVAVADFAGDGTPDLAVVDGSGVSLVPDAQGGARPTAQVPGASFVAAGWFDGDEHRDLAAAGDSLVVLRGDGAGGFGDPETVELGDAVTSILAADGRGSTLLLLTTEADDIALLAYDAAKEEKGESAFGVSVQASLAVSGMALGKLDQDTERDLVVGRPEGFAVLRGLGGSFGSPAEYQLDRERPRDPAAGDLDGDGKTDLVLGSDAGVFVVPAGSTVFLPFAVCAGVMLAGLVLVRTAARAHAGRADEHREQIDALQKSIGATIEKLTAMTAARETIDVYDVHGRIDDELMEDVGDFVAARKSMIPLMGLRPYAEVMSAFAAGERNLNRAWSASADGYEDEVWASLDRALARMNEAKGLLARYREETGH